MKTRTTTRSKSPGFTLIELLVVVGIIAILASIGLMNFLEAQVRSKVSRTKADMRTFTTALETYAVDHAGYPATFELTALTTPVAYSTAFVRDVFASDGSPWLGYMNARQQSTPAELQQWSVSTYTPAQQAALSEHQYLLWSNGPDMEDTALKNTQQSFYEVVNAPQANGGLFYDPTNGTVSGGDVVRSPKINR